MSPRVLQETRFTHQEMAGRAVDARRGTALPEQRDFGDPNRGYLPLRGKHVESESDSGRNSSSDGDGLSGLEPRTIAVSRDRSDCN